MTRRKREALRVAAEQKHQAEKKKRTTEVEHRESKQAVAVLARPRDLNGDLADHILRKGWHPDPNATLLARACYKVAKYLGTPEQNSCFGDLMAVIHDRAPKIAGAQFWQPCYTLAGLEWIRPLAEWKPAGKADEAVFCSLVDHLLVRYPVPRFLYGVFHLDAVYHGYAHALASLFAALARGESAYEYFSEHLPAVMTRRMCHFFTQSAPHTGVYRAVRQAQVRALGGSRAIASAICYTDLGRNFVLHEETWFEIMRWFCAQPDLVPAAIGPLVDYVESETFRAGTFSIKGRTVASLTRQMEAWHAQLAKYDKADDTVFTKSGVRKGYWEVTDIAKRGARFDRAVWTIEEVLSARDLAEEGRAMEHCVYSYRGDIQEGASSIWSLRRESKRMLTVEVATKDRAIVQAKGRCNRGPSSLELNILKQWAQESNLLLRVRE